MNKVTQYVNEVRQELSKVSWSKREELIETTWVVLFICIVFAILVFSIDIVLNRVINAIL
jgi:preprotein translocase subunit SecE